MKIFNREREKAEFTDAILSLTKTEREPRELIEKILMVLISKLSPDKTGLRVSPFLIPHIGKSFIGYDLKKIKDINLLEMNQEKTTRTSIEFVEVSPQFFKLKFSSCGQLELDLCFSNSLNLDGIYRKVEFLEEINSTLSLIEAPIRELLSIRTTGLYKLYNSKGKINWEEKVGIIFLDVNQYSSLAEEFGEQYLQFISHHYFPGLIAHVSNHAVVEHIVGDEILFVTVKELLKYDLTIERATALTIEKIDEFVVGEGLRLCRSFGYPPVSVSIAANCGHVLIESNENGVTISGSEVNHTKRLLDDAGPSGILLKSSSGISLDPKAYLTAAERLVLGKKNVVLATPIYRNFMGTKSEVS